MHSEDELREFLAGRKWGHEVKVVQAREERNEFFFPGFIGMFLFSFSFLSLELERLGKVDVDADEIDTHIHAPQYPNSGLFGSSTLLDWLQTYTFPLEKSYGDRKAPDAVPPKAITSYNQVVSRTLSHGTTSACYFATIHVPATNYLASLCHNRGQRAFIGRVCMDNEDTCPADLRNTSADESVTATKANITHIQSLDPFGNLVKPIITPRFAPSCTAQTLSELGALATEYNPPLHIQTHISENKDEIALVKELYPDSANYADVYDKANLLTPRTILAHGIHLSPQEREVVSARKSKISHCPVSNSAIGSGLCPVRVLRDSGITVGLGTDVSGGYNPGILESVRQAILVSRLLRHTVREGDTCENAKNVKEGRENLSVEEGLYLATRGGAEVVDMGDEIGGFEVGMSWDAQMIQLGSVEPALAVGSGTGSHEKRENSGSASNVDIFDWENWTEKVHKWVWNGDDRNVSKVWVRGRLVHERDEKEAGKGEKKRGWFWEVACGNFVGMFGIWIAVQLGVLKIS